MFNIYSYLCRQNAEFRGIFAYYEPHAYLLRGFAYHPVCANYHGQAAHSPYHWYGAGRYADW